MQAVHFDTYGRSRVRPVAVHSFDIGPGIDIPDLASVFPSSIRSDVLVVTFQRVSKTFAVHFPHPRPAASAGHTPRGREPSRANVLVFRARHIAHGYKDCTADDIPWVEQAVDL